MRKVLLSIVALLAILAVPAAAQTLRAGDGALNTPLGGQTVFDLRTVPIQEVFGASLQSNPRVDLFGRPFPDLPGVDSVMRRDQDVTIGASGTATSPVVIVALSLESETPVLIGNQKFRLNIVLSDFPQPRGSATYRRVNADGGTFSATLPVVPKLIFTDIEKGSQVVIDCAVVGCRSYVLQVANAGWVRTDGPGGFDPASRGMTLLNPGTPIGNTTSIGNGNFVAGITATNTFPEAPYNILIPEPEPPVEHWVRPPIPPFDRLPDPGPFAIF
jgi:hypothetical protein